MSGAFGKEITESLDFVTSLPVEHPLLSNEIENVLIDNDIDTSNAEHHEPEFLKKLLLECPFALRETVWDATLVT